MNTKTYIDELFKKQFPFKDGAMRCIPNPPIEDLIEECGEKLIALRRFEKGEILQGMECDEAGWQAEGKDCWHIGETPVEALAYFWIAECTK